MTAHLEVEDVTVRFGGLTALDRVSIVVPEGKVVGLIGPNGAGKSTLFNVVSGLQQASGRVRFAGVDVTKVPTHRRARLGMGRAFQHLGLIPDESVEANLMAAQHLSAGYSGWSVLLPGRRARRERALRDRAWEVAATYGLTEVLDARVRDLSFGVARFVELACVQVERPALMLLDEPTTGLDLIETQRLLELLRSSASRGATILVVAHDVRFTMELCDTIYVLAEGSVLCEGTPAEVQGDPRVIEAYLGRAS